MAFAGTMLAWGGITWSEGYEVAGQTEYMTDCIKWTADYFIAAHTDKFEFVGQVTKNKSGLAQPVFANQT